MSAQKIGFVGLGAMGTAMARNLVNAGYDVSVYNRTRSRADEFAKEGGTVAGTPAAAASGGIVFTMLADDRALESAVLGDGGIAMGLPRGGIHVSVSTIGVACSKRLAAAHAERGQHYVTAPVFGRPVAAAAAKLFFVTAGAAEPLERVRPILERLGHQIFVVGEAPEQANLVKLSGNFLITCVIEGLAEVFTLVGKAGIEHAQMLEILTNTLFGAPVYNTYGNLIVSGKFTPPGFALPLGLKDNRLLLEAADTLEVPLPFANVVRDRFLTALATGHGGEDWAAFAQVVAAQAGTEPFAG
jgi:3-hydroxyisobutyrate dehydrogenase-like beta-hydroxyacid dehydrogenase